jgi:hypothetical protein
MSASLWGEVHIYATVILMSSYVPTFSYGAAAAAAFPTFIIKHDILCAAAAAAAAAAAQVKKTMNRIKQVLR